MTTLSHSRRTVKPFALLFSGQTRRNPAFGRGVFEQRERRLPVGPSDADREFVREACPATAPTAAESLDHVRCTTLHPIQFNGLMEELADMARHRSMVESGLADW